MGHPVRGPALAAPEPIEVPNVLGDIERYTATAFAHFEIDGQALQLEGHRQSRWELWFIFRDLTSGKETCPATRFLPRRGWRAPCPHLQR